jgi:subtilase family serine protease
LSHPSNNLQPFGSTGPTGYTPAQIRHAYGFDQVSFPGAPADGSGTTIAIVDAYDDPNIASDLNAFDAQFGLPAANFTKVNQSGGSTMPAGNTGWAQEISLDVEWAHAVAPGARILLVEASDASDTNLYTAVKYAASQLGVVAVSMSWGGSEYSGETSDDSTFLTPGGHTGVVFVASSGDSGAPVSYPAASPNVLAVGGTTLNLSSGNYGSESGWSGSGGGISAYENQPAYQQGVVTQSTTRRTNPDVAYDADPNTGFPVYITYGNSASAPWLQFGGTSDAAPQWAALVAIADQGRALQTESALTTATLLSSVYQLPATDFHDVTSGTSTGSPHYSAGAGYDLVTGRGTPVANLVVGALVGSTVTPPSPAPATHFSVSSSTTSPVAGTAFTVTVTALDANNTKVTGYTGTVQFTSSDLAAFLPGNYAFSSGDSGSRTFSVTLNTSGTQSVTATDVSNSSLTGSATLSVTTPAPVGSGTVIESFETNGPYYVANGYRATAQYYTGAAHDGSWGLDDWNGKDWIYRTDSAVQVKQGDSISVWLQFAGSADGGAYFGFGASSGGTLSLVASPGNNQLQLQDNRNWGSTVLASVSQSYQANSWYRLQVNWAPNGKITGQLYDANGNLLNTVVATDTRVASGGIAFKATGSDKYWDTVADNRGVVTNVAQPKTGTGTPAPNAPKGGVPTGSNALAAAIDQMFALWNEAQGLSATAKKGVLSGSSLDWLEGLLGW